MLLSARSTADLDLVVRRWRCWIATALAALWVSPVAVNADPGVMEAVDDWRKANAHAVLRDLADLIRLRSESRNRDALLGAAKALQSRLSGLGYDAELLYRDGGEGVPLVWASRDVPDGKLTVGIYMHLDTVAAAPEQWSLDPFEPRFYNAAISAGGVEVSPPDSANPDPDWRLYGRGAADAKGPIAAFLATSKALVARRILPSVNVRVLLDTEEEIGSPNLRAIAAAHAGKLHDVDLWLFFDTPQHASGRPQLVFGVRGIAAMELTAYGAERPLHNGHFGNWAPDPSQQLAALLASLKDPRSGRVLVDGFYDEVAPMSPADEAAVRDLAQYDAALIEALKFARSEGKDEPLAERILLPSLNIRGLQSGGVGDAARNAIPATARASLGLRLIPGQSASRTFERLERHFERQGFRVVRTEPTDAQRRNYPRLLKVERIDYDYDALRVPVDGPYTAVLSDIVAAAAGREAGPVLLQPMAGGSLPLDKLRGDGGAPVIVVPTVNYDNNQHAADENVRIGNLWYAMRVFAGVLTMPVPAPETRR